MCIRDSGSGDWVNMHWGDGSMGVTVGFSNNDDGNGTTSSDMSVAYGNTFDWGEIGVKYMTANDGGDTNLGVDYRTDFGFWLVDNTVVSVTNLVWYLESGDDCDMHITADFWSAMDVGGADLVYAWGVRQGGSNAELTQTATLGVAANKTEWATIRAGMNWWYQ